MKPEYPLYINGEFKDSPQKSDIVNPSTDEVFARVSTADKNDAASAISAARAAFDTGKWRGISLPERKGFLLKIARGILDKARELAELETLNCGKPIKESTFMDIPSAAKTFEYFANNLEKYLKDETIELENAESLLLR